MADGVDRGRVRGDPPSFNSGYADFRDDCSIRPSSRVHLFTLAALIEGDDNMIYGKIWCVVKPSVGVPIIIGAVAVASFSVHLALTLNTTWVKRFLNGSAAQVSVAPSEAIQPVAALTIPNTLRK